MTNHISCQYPDLKKVDLSKIFSYLLRKNGPYHKDQKRLGKDIGLAEPARQSTVSQIKNNSPQWEEHWRAFWLLLEICAKHGIHSARDLEVPSATEVITDELPDGKTAGADGTKGKKSVKKASSRAVSARRIKGSF